MLNWIQNLLERHRKLFFGGLLIVIIVPFVFTIGNMPGIAHKRNSGAGVLFGCDLSDRKAVERIVRDGAVSISIDSGSDENAWVESAQGYALLRIMLIKMADDMKLPKPNDDALLSFIKSKKMFFGADGEFDAKKYNEYLANWESSHSKTDSLRSILEDDYRCNEVKSILQEPGFISNDEIAMLYRNWTRTLNMSIVSLNINEHACEQLTEAEVLEFFSSNSEKYKVDKKAEVSLLFFDFKNYKNVLHTPTNDELRAHFAGNKQKFATAEISDPAFEVVEQAVRKDWEREMLSKVAERESNNFIRAVYESDVKLNSDAWNNLLSTYKVRMFDAIEPFTKGDIPEKKGLSKESLQVAFELDDEKFVADPVSVKNAYMVVVLKKMHDAFVQKFSDVAAKVADDANASHRQKTFEEKVKNLRTELVAANGDFSSVLNKFGVGVRKLDPFSFDTMFKVLGKEIDLMSLFYFAKNLQTMAVGEWTEEIKMNAGLALLHLDSQSSCDVDSSSEEFIKFSKNTLLRRKSERADFILKELLENAFKDAFPEKIKK